MVPDALFVDEVRAIQASMNESASGHFVESELEGLRCVVRLTVEFSHHLDEELNHDEVMYLCESIFAGIESFCSVVSAYRAMGRSTSRVIPWDALTMESLKRLFQSAYSEFLSETDLAERCGILIDLFRLQIVYAGRSYR